MKYYTKLNHKKLASNLVYLSQAMKPDVAYMCKKIFNIMQFFGFLIYAKKQQCISAVSVIFNNKKQ